MDAGPTDDDLRALVRAMLANLHDQLREPEVIDETIRDHRDMWTKLYQAGLGHEASSP